MTHTEIWARIPASVLVAVAVALIILPIYQIQITAAVPPVILRIIFKPLHHNGQLRLMLRIMRVWDRITMDR